MPKIATNQIASQIIPELVNISQDSVYPTVEERNKGIIAQRVLYGMKQSDLAKQYNLSEGMISRIVNEGAWDTNIQSFIKKSWEKDVSNRAKGLVLQLLDNINPKKVPMAGIHNLVGTLIDKVRLIDGEVTERIEVRTLDMAELLKVLR